MTLEEKLRNLPVSPGVYLHKDEGGKIIYVGKAKNLRNRVLVYSLADGEQKGRFFGGRPTVSKAANLLSVENERGQLIVYDLATMAKRDEFTFNSPVALTRFSPDGKRLFVLTANQTAYTLNLFEKEN